MLPRSLDHIKQDAKWREADAGYRPTYEIATAVAFIMSFRLGGLVPAFKARTSSVAVSYLPSPWRLLLREWSYVRRHTQATILVRQEQVN